MLNWTHSSVLVCLGPTGCNLQHAALAWAVSAWPVWSACSRVLPGSIRSVPSALLPLRLYAPCFHLRGLPVLAPSQPPPSCSAEHAGLLKGVMAWASLHKGLGRNRPALAPFLKLTLSTTPGIHPRRVSLLFSQNNQFD